MYKIYCGYDKCTKGIDGLPKIVFAYAKSKTGELPEVYCCKECEANAKYEKRFK